MAPVSIVIITNKLADIKAGCLEKARLLTDDIVIISNGSLDETLDTDGLDGCKVYSETWDGYGANKNKGIKAAKYDWILSIDADEVPDSGLVKALHEINLKDPAVVYDIKFKSYFGKKPIRFGNWGRDHHIRLFNRRLVKWSETLVHEKLLLPESIQTKKIGGHLHHYSVKNAAEYESKGFYYAKLTAKKYFSNGKSTNIVKQYLSPLFGFLKGYIVLLGFLDGREGWEIAKTTLKNTWRKYHHLSLLQKGLIKKEPVKESAAPLIKESIIAVKDGFLVEY